MVDVRVKQIDLPPEVSESVYRRMNAVREKEARERRSQVRAQQNPDRVVQRQGTGTRKGQHEQADHGAALQDRGDADTEAHAANGGGG